jgi:hypothetical protein
LVRTLIRDTRPGAQDGAAGYGINVTSPLPGHLARLILRDVVLADNAKCGVAALGAALDIARTIVRDTTVTDTHNYGIGLYLVDAFKLPATLTLRDSLLLRNQTFGILMYSSTAEIHRSVVRDTWLANDTSGDGIAAGLGPTKKPSRLEVRDSLVAGNRRGAVNAADTDTWLERSVVRDTGPRADGTCYGVVGYRRQLERRPVLAIRDASILENCNVGVVVRGAELEAERVVISKTQSLLHVGRRERSTGLYVASNLDHPNNAAVRDALVIENQGVGVYLEGAVTTSLARVFVDHTRPTELTGVEGMGIVADIQDLELLDSRVAGGALTGIFLAGDTRAVVRRTTIRDTAEGLGVLHPHQIMSGFGDGVLVQADATLELEDSLVAANARAGALFFGGGSVRRSVFQDGVFSIAVESGDPEIADSNVMQGNQEDRITFGSNLSAPMPPQPPPPL